MIKGEYKQAIYKAKEIDLKATIVSLGVNETVYLPFNPRLKTSAIRMAASRLNQQGEARYTVNETLNGTTITRTI